MPERILSDPGGKCLTARYDIDLLSENPVKRIPARPPCFTHARIMRPGYDKARLRKQSQKGQNATFLPDPARNGGGLTNNEGASLWL
jgi:hypothetical protein